MLDVLASPVGHLLALIHSTLSTVLIPASGPAWALSIVLLTVLVRLILFPLFVKQIKSQRRMQQLAPKIKELQKQHKGDRETMNVEMMKLYKENNANPISGCLPLLLQLPVFFALFSVIREFKPGAEPRYGLSAQLLEEGGKAKVFGAPISSAFNSPMDLLAQLDGNQTTVRIVAAIMVVLMGATTFYTQRQMIARSGTTDPQQLMVQKLLLYVLPLSFAVSGAFFPIGVLLYWLTTNVWSMGQQAYVIKRMPPIVFTPEGGPKSTGKDSPKGGSAVGSSKPPKASKRGDDPDKGSGNGPDSPEVPPTGGGDPTVLTTSSPASGIPASVGGRTPAVTPKAPMSQAANRRPAGSRKNKRRGGRR